jgi:hypothetical protein
MSKQAPAAPTTATVAETCMAAALTQLRTFLLPCWNWTHQNYINHGQRFFLNKRAEIPTPVSQDMCRHTTLFMLQLLEQAGDKRWLVAGGFINHRNDPGIYGESGLWLQHWWLENGEHILDLTADQFGWECVVLAPVTDARYSRQPEQSKKQRVATLKGSVAQWRGENASFWASATPEFIAIKASYPAANAAFVAAWHAATPALTD